MGDGYGKVETQESVISQEIEELYDNDDPVVESTPATERVSVPGAGRRVERQDTSISQDAVYYDVEAPEAPVPMTREEILAILNEKKDCRPPPKGKSMKKVMFIGLLLMVFLGFASTGGAYFMLQRMGEKLNTLQMSEASSKSNITSLQADMGKLKELNPGCAFMPCLNGGVCSQNESFSFFCDCSAIGFTGDQCETEAPDHCETSHCLNGGTCTNTKSGYECSCLSNFIGDQCQKYYPEGPQFNVTMSTVLESGWKECFRQTYDKTLSMSIFNEIRDSKCTEKYVLLGCKQASSQTLKVMAAAPHADVFRVTDTEQRQNRGQQINKSKWYLLNKGENAVGSWGFAGEFDSINLNYADNTADVESGMGRLSWHLNDKGWRCGTNTALLYDSDWEKIVFTTDH